MKKLILLIIFQSINCFSQAPTIQWQKSLGGSGEETAVSILQTSDGGYVIGGITNSSNGDVVGYTWPYNATTRDYWIVKTDSNGVIIWQKVYGGSGTDLLTKIKSTSDGGYIVCGYSISTNGTVTGPIGNYDYWILKLDSLGNIEWQKSLGGTNEDYATDILQTNDGGYIVIGDTKSTNGNVIGNHGLFDIWIVKLNNLGVIEWRKTYGGSNDDRISSQQGNFSIAQTLDGGYIFTGKTKSTNGDLTVNKGLNDVWVVKINNTGTIEWQKTYGGTNEDFGQSIIQTNDGNYVVTAGTNSNDLDIPNNLGQTDLWVFKIDQTGTIIWNKIFGGTLSESYSFSSLIETNDGNLIINSSTLSNNGDATGNHSSGSYDVWLLKLNSLGIKQWHRCFGGRSDDSGFQVIQTMDNGYMISGYNLPHINPSGADWTFNNGSYDAWLIKLNSETLSNDEFENNIDFTIYPNPTKNTINLFSKNNKIISEIIIYNSIGQIIKRAYGNSTAINVENLSNGLYFMEIKIENKIYKTKFVKE